MKLLEDANITGKRVFLRADYNVLDKKGNLTDDYRIRESIPTINYLLRQKAKQVIIATHIGRPNGRAVKELTTERVAKRLSELLGKDVRKLNDCIGKGVERAILEGDTIVMLENLRFHKEEEENNDQFAKKLAKLADVYVNDAFGASHRAHASVVAITKHISSCAGLLIQKEVKVLTKVLKNPEKPMVVLLGGAKVSDKLGIITNMIKNADYVLIGGAMAFTFLKAKGIGTGKSLVEDDKIGAAKALIENRKIVLPEDIVVASKVDSGAKYRIADVGNIPSDQIGVDIGPKTINLFSEKIRTAKTVVWNGPMGVFEFKPFAKGTNAMAKAIADSDALTVVGGGETITALTKDLREGISHISTGGGAMLEFLEGRQLPALEALRN